MTNREKEREKAGNRMISEMVKHTFDYSGITGLTCS